MEASNLVFCFENLFKTRVNVESRSFFSLKEDLNFSSSINLFEDPFAFLNSDRNTVPVTFDTGARLAITYSKEDFIKPSQHHFFVAWFIVWKLWVLEKFLGHLHLLIVLYFILSMIGIMSLKERQDCLVLNAYSIKKQRISVYYWDDEEKISLNIGESCNWGSM